MSHAIPPCAEPPTWGQLAGLPYPHLGKCQLGTALDLARGQGGPPFLYSVDQIEGRLAFADVIVGLNLHAQTMYPDSLRRLRGLNPSVVILPYRIAEKQQNLPVPRGSGVDLDYNFWQGFSDGRYMRNSSGNYIYETSYPFIHLVNISSFAPVVKGQTYFSYMLTWLDDLVFPSGLWDGLFFDNLVASINPQIPNYNNPALLDFDFTLSGVHQSPAAVSDMTRSAATGMLQQFRALNGDLQLVLGNTGAFPPLQLAPYVNGWVFECFNYNWNGPFLPNESVAGWRDALDAYRAMQATTRPPRIDVLEGCGQQYTYDGSSGYHPTPTAADILTHRFTMGTALLGDGFLFLRPPQGRGGPRRRVLELPTLTDTSCFAVGS